MNNMKDLVTVTSEGIYWPVRGEGTYNHLKNEAEQNGGHLSVLSKYLKTTNVMVQAGGNCGLLLIPFINKFKRIYTFEPDPVNFYCLNLNLASTNVYKFQGCLGEEHGLVDLCEPFVDEIGAFHVSNGRGSIPKFKLDDLCLDECNLLMLDIEGYEFHALRGALETIAKHKPVICVECNPQWLARFGSSVQHIEYLLTKMGYRFAETYGVTSQDRIYIPT